MIREQSRALSKFVLFFDLLIVFVSFFIGYFIRARFAGIIESVMPMNVYVGLLPVLLIIWGSLLYYFGMYESIGAKRISDVLVIVSKTAVLGFVLFGSYIFVLHLQEEVTRLAMGIIFILSFILITLEKIALIYIFRQLRGKDSFKGALFAYRNLLVVGTGIRARKFMDLIKAHPDWALRIAGLVDMDDAKKGKVIKGHKVLGSLHDIPDIIHNNIIDEVVFIVPRSWLNKIEEVMLFCENEGLTINVAVDLFELKFSKAQQASLHGFPLLTFSGTSHRLEYLFIKRVVDFMLSAIAVIVFVPVLVLLALIIKITSTGPVFFKQKRCGLYGRQFMFYKFRTMVVDAESQLSTIKNYNEMDGPVFKMTNDPRITKIGKWLRKFSLDELPQLWNVLKGDMSLVGPRPPLPDEVVKYDSWQRRKLSMRPGITCLWQISGRSEIASFDEWMKLDLEYIDKWSLWLDAKILLRTIPAVLFSKGAK